MDRYFFNMAIDIARQNPYFHSPNPSVGALLVKDGSILAQSCTKEKGSFHAEKALFEGVKDIDAKGATVYVTLEPCVDFLGKTTSACTTLLIQKGIKRVVYGSLDPNPKVTGKGIKELLSHNIKVEQIKGFEKELYLINRDFFTNMKYQKSYVIAKYAMTLDGKIASLDGKSKWITNIKSRIKAHEQRSKVDAILVGKNTVYFDDPSLTVRMSFPQYHPLRVILDPNFETSLDKAVLKDKYPSLFLVSKDHIITTKEKNLPPEKQIWRYDFPFDWNLFIKDLYQKKQIMSLMVEGGGSTLFSLLNQNCVDEVWAFIAPRLLGGRGISPFEGDTNRSMIDSIPLYDSQFENLEGDIFVKAYTKELTSSIKEFL